MESNWDFEENDAQHDVWIEYCLHFSTVFWCGFHQFEFPQNVSLFTYKSQAYALCYQ